MCEDPPGITSYIGFLSIHNGLFSDLLFPKIIILSCIQKCLFQLSLYYSGDI